MEERARLSSALLKYRNTSLAHGELENPSDGQSLRASVKKILFEQEDAKKRGMKGLTR